MTVRVPGATLPPRTASQALGLVAAGEFGAEVEEAPWAREIEIRDPDGSRVRVATPED